ncbi:MAG TPA: M48 family metalloprotease, partial [Acidimicrobiales bacterium]
MNLDTANRNFYGLLTLAAAPFLLAGALGCGVLTLTAYRIVTNGRTDALTGPTAIPAGLFLTAAALGALLAMRSLIVQHRATRRLAGHLRSRWIPPTERLQDIAAEAGLVRVNLVDDGDAYSLTFGLLRPRVVISRGLVDRSSDRELAAVLVHERYHVANLDPLKITLARAVTAG